MQEVEVYIIKKLAGQGIVDHRTNSGQIKYYSGNKGLILALMEARDISKGCGCSFVLDHTGFAVQKFIDGDAREVGQ